MKTSSSLSLGPDVVQLLLPHRRPFLMVDAIEGYERAPRPTLRATRHIASNEPVFEGHFPGIHLWPGVYTIEGMGQSCNLLHILWSLQRAWEELREDPEEVLLALRNLELGYKLKPGFRPEVSARLLRALTSADPEAPSRMGMAAAVEVKLLTPVFAGQRLDYIVVQTHLLDNLVRFEVEAQVEGRAVARGVMTSSRDVRFPSRIAPP